MKRIYLETFGCQMNVLDSELIEGQLRQLDYQFTPDCATAEIVLYNTCSVRQHSEDKVFSRLGLMKIRKQTEPDLIVGVIGCLAERDGAALLKRLPHVDILCGPGQLDQLPALLESTLRNHRQQAALAGDTSRRSGTLAAAEDSGLELLDLSRSFAPRKNRYQAYLRVVRGCNKFCSYCVVPYTRGPEISRAPQAIIQEARRLVDAGAMEITLLGQTINHYRYEHPAARGAAGAVPRCTTFAELLYQLHESLPTLPRLRFVTSFPADFGDDVLQVMAQCPRLCPYLHIPAQSGSNRILRLMNRGYTAESYLDLLQRARRIVPGIALAGDIIVGFPTETEADYQATRTLVEQARYRNCFIFKYSPRPGTVALRRYADDVPDEEKRRRNRDLLTLQNTITHELNQQEVGREVTVLCEGPSGWRESAESIIAGAPQAATRSPAGPVAASPRVELGPRLAAAMDGASSRHAAAFPRLSQPVTRDPQLATSRQPCVQLTGRTATDQIVVFDGSPTLEGRMVRVRIHAVHGLTAFGRLKYPAARE